MVNSRRFRTHRIASRHHAVITALFMDYKTQKAESLAEFRQEPTAY